jgi:hypothetical protein
MTKLEKLMEVNTMAKFLDYAIQDCTFCPCMEDNICGGFCKDCTEKFKEYLLTECDENQATKVEA